MTENETMRKTRDALMKALECQHETPSWELLDYRSWIAAIIRDEETTMEEKQAFGREMMQLIETYRERLLDKSWLNTVVMTTYSGFLLFCD